MVLVQFCIRNKTYAICNLKSSEKYYPVHKLEFLALKWAICEKIRDYLFGSKFEVLTDNNPLNTAYYNETRCYRAVRDSFSLRL